MRRLVPNIIKPVIRFLYYKNERKKVFREIGIRRQQNNLFNKQYATQIEGLIVFIVDGTDWFTGKDSISGGILSIASIYEHTKKLKVIHKSEVIMVTNPDGHLLLKHTQFPNDIIVYRFSQLRKFKYLKNVLVHIPEYKVSIKLADNIKRVFNNLSTNQIHINVLNQRIDIMPSPEVVGTIKEQGFKMTQTTAHEQYTTQELRDKYQIPLHKLSVYATPERYQFKEYTKKENLILVSPDSGQLKKEILMKITQGLPGYTIKIIDGITYMEYLSLVEKAKFTITFGEGLDFYFIETVFSGGLSFAVYNNDFFTSDFKGIEGVFDSYEQMLMQLKTKIELFNTSAKYIQVNKKQFDKCHKIYNGKSYSENLKNFYKNKYLFP